MDGDFLLDNRRHSSGSCRVNPGFDCVPNTTLSVVPHSDAGLPNLVDRSKDGSATDHKPMGRGVLGYLLLAQFAAPTASSLGGGAEVLDPDPKISKDSLGAPSHPGRATGIDDHKQPNGLIASSDGAPSSALSGGILSSSGHEAPQQPTTQFTDPGTGTSLGGGAEGLGSDQIDTPKVLDPERSVDNLGAPSRDCRATGIDTDPKPNGRGATISVLSDGIRPSKPTTTHTVVTPVLNDSQNHGDSVRSALVSDIKTTIAPISDPITSGGPDDGKSVLLGCSLAFYVYRVLPLRRPKKNWTGSIRTTSGRVTNGSPRIIAIARLAMISVGIILVFLSKRLLSS